MHFNIILFTELEQELATKIIDKLNISLFIVKRYFREVYFIKLNIFIYKGMWWSSKRIYKRYF